MVLFWLVLGQGLEIIVDLSSSPPIPFFQENITKKGELILITLPAPEFRDF